MRIFRIKWRTWVIVILLIFAFSGYVVRLNEKHYLSYELVFTYGYQRQVRDPQWTCASKGGFADPHTLNRDYLKRTGNELPENFDYDATYIVCYGGTLEGVYYKYCSYYGNTPRYYAYPIIREAKEDMVYIYKLKTDVVIDYDIHTTVKQYATILPKDE